MRLLALVDSPDHVCCRYRIRAFEPALNAAGWSLTCQGLAEAWSECLRSQLPQASGFDAVILQRKLLAGWQLRFCAGTRASLVFDFDDAVLFRDSYDRRGPYSAGARTRFAATVRIADAVIAGNDFLADCAPRAGARRERVRTDPHLRRAGSIPMPGRRRGPDRTDGTTSTLSGSVRRARSRGSQQQQRSGIGWAARSPDCGSV